MMLMRVELYCNGLGGRAPHGYVDVRVRGFDEEEALDVLLSQVARDFGDDHIVWDDIQILEERDNHDFDYGDVYAAVIGGEGDALMYNPIGKQFSL